MYFLLNVVAKGYFVDSSNYLGSKDLPFSAFLLKGTRCRCTVMCLQMFAKPCSPFFCGTANKELESIS
jgi:hypothetical protein